MDVPTAILLAVLIGVLAMLYSAVGHGGASGYLAAMALLGLAPEAMRPTALALNVLVAGLAWWRFYGSTTFAWPTFGWLASTSVPCAFLGGLWILPAHFYQPLVAVVLLVAAWQIVRRAMAQPARPAVGAASTTASLSASSNVPRLAAMGSGAGIGLLAGLTGVGGGIFLSPLLLLCGWAEPRATAALSAAFVLVNSLAGLGGHVATLHVLPGWILLWAPVAAAAGLLGATLGSRRLKMPALQCALSLVLVLAAIKLILV